MFNSIVMILRKKSNILLFFVKTLIILSISFYASHLHGNYYYFLFCIIDFIILNLITLLLNKNNSKIAIVFNFFSTFFLLINQTLLIFGGSFLNRIMLTNIHNLRDLSANFFKYSIFLILIVSISFIRFQPNKKIIVKKYINVIICIILVKYSLIFALNKNYSAITNYYSVALTELRIQYRLRFGSSQLKDEFYNNSMEFCYSKKNDVTHPNVILIFTEGLSQHIIDDKRNIMPNIRKYQKQSINFTNYYNHTFATYRGLSGQLYSGYQFDNLDKNNLISINDILTKNGYETVFINTEPNFPDFTNFLESFNFNEYINNTNYCDGPSDTISDKSAYDLLYKTAKKMNSSESPYFISMYTFETHMGTNSTGKKFGNGKNQLLNRFFNVDYQFGIFMKKMKKDGLLNNTIIIFTSDHATYKDSDYIKTFRNYYKRFHTGLDIIPFFIYDYSNGVKQEINVNGRNSLDISPTILDYININSDNYFLGESLFCDKHKNEYDYIFYDTNVYGYTKDNKINDFQNNYYKNKIYDYFSVSRD